MSESRATPESDLQKRLLSRAAAADRMVPIVGGTTTNAGRTFEVDAKLFRDAAELIANLAKAYVAERAALLSALSAGTRPVIDEPTAMLLAAISTASIQNTRESAKQRIGKDNPYWTAAYGDVCDAVDREMEQRERAEEAEALLRVQSASEASMPETSKEVHDTLMDAERYRWLRDDCSQEQRAEVFEMAEKPYLLDHFIDKGRCGL